MKHLKEAVSLYSDNLLLILVLIVVVVLPIQIIEMIFAVSSFILFSFEGPPIIGYVNVLFFSMISLNLVQGIFIKLAGNKTINEDVTLKEILIGYLKSIVPILVYTFLGVISVIVGLALFVLPGIFMLLLLIMYPYVLLIDEKREKPAFIQVFDIVKGKSVEILLIVIFYVSLNYLTWYLMAFGAIQISDDLVTFIVLRMLINCIIIPLFVFTVTLNYRDWSPESFEVLEAK